MIVNVAGTSGSGKSHLARDLLDWLRARYSVTPVYEPGRAAPLGYRVVINNPPKRYLYIVGNYLVPTGGCDTIEPVDRVFDLIDDRHQNGYDVFYEGLFVMNQTRGPQLAESWPGEVTVIRLNTSLEQCLASVDARRAERGNSPIDNRSNIRQNYKRAQNYSARMSEAGAKVLVVGRNEALAAVLRALSLG